MAIFMPSDTHLMTTKYSGDDMIDNQFTGKRIRIMLAARGLNQGDLSKLTGYHSSIISLLCNDKVHASEEQIKNIKAILDWPTDDQAEIAFGILAGDGDER
jgi:hypothetical protein